MAKIHRGGTSIIQQMVTATRQQLAFLNVLRLKFREHFGVALVMRPVAFSTKINEYVYQLEDGGNLTPPQEKWVEGFASGWELLEKWSLDWDKASLDDRRALRASEEF